MVSLYAWRDRIPYAVEMLHTVALFIDSYPGPTRVGEFGPQAHGWLCAISFACAHAFLDHSVRGTGAALFWEYFTALGLLLAALLYESITLYLLLAFFGLSSMWTLGGWFACLHTHVHTCMCMHTHACMTQHYPLFPCLYRF